MPITYRGVSQSEIAASLEALALRLLTLDVGVLTTTTADVWLSENGIAAQIRTATDKTQITSALASRMAHGSAYDTQDWLHLLYNRVLPNAFDKADQTTKIALVSEIGAVAAWDGFNRQGGTTGALLAEHREILAYCRENFGMQDFSDGKTFAPNIFRGAYIYYQVYADINAPQAIDMIVAYAAANGVADECVKNDYGTQDGISLTPQLAQRVVNEIALLQALGHNGRLITKTVTPPPPAPKA